MSSIARKKATHGEARDFFNDSMKIETDDCIIWPFSNYKGYGRLGIKGKFYSVPRMALTYHRGEPYNPNLHATHLPIICHNPACFNYRHLRWATHQRNMVDKKLDGTNRTERGEKNGRAKLTSEQVLAIRADKRLNRIIAEEYGVAKGYVSLIKRRVSWAWLD